MTGSGDVPRNVRVRFNPATLEEKRSQHPRLSQDCEDPLGDARGAVRAVGMFGIKRQCNPHLSSGPSVPRIGAG
jgi:hypothetical protein